MVGLRINVLVDLLFLMFRVPSWDDKCGLWQSACKLLRRWFERYEIFVTIANKLEPVSAFVCHMF